MSGKWEPLERGTPAASGRGRRARSRGWREAAALDLRDRSRLADNAMTLILLRWIAVTALLLVVCGVGRCGWTWTRVTAGSSIGIARYRTS